MPAASAEGMAAMEMAKAPDVRRSYSYEPSTGARSYGNRGSRASSATLLKTDPRKQNGNQ